MIAHNLFGFDMFFFLKGYQATAWCTKEIKHRGSNLTKINFTNIGGEVKFIVTLKYYQKSLAESSSTLSDEEKNSVKQLTKQFLSFHHYFHGVWFFFGTEQKRRVLDIIADEKGIITYGKIVDMKSLTPENGDFFEKTEFCSDLKKKGVCDDEYGSSLYLFETLKMRNLGDINDLNNAQDLILLCKIAENKFQYMHKLYGFNPRRCNSASTLSGCIESWHFQHPTNPLKYLNKQ